MPTAPVYADLHAHTTASDGTETPTELVTLARAAGLTYLAVTDHDTTAALAEAERAAREVGIRLLPGVELSAEGKPGKCHLLGLGIDPSHAPLTETLAALSESRRRRNEQMVERLHALGAPLTLDEITALAPPGANIGRPHFAHALIVRGYVRDNAEAFAKYLADDAAAYVTKKTLTPAAAIDLVHAAGGLCFIAHPGLLRLAEHETYETRLRALQAVGLDGLEAYYSAYTPALTDQLVRLAAKLDLLVTGGSDFHGANKAHVTLGAVLDGGPLPASLLPHTLLDRALPA
jgi:predicted metal-dependent phosphoesterase TrpH